MHALWMGTRLAWNPSLKPEDIAQCCWQAVNGKKVVHILPRIDLKLFVRLAGFQGIARPMMKMFSRM